MGKLFKLLLWVALVLGVIIGIARLVAIRWWRVPTGDPMLEASVAPTLRGGDWVLLWRATAPRFGGLVVCPDPEDPSHIVIGRIVGEERDKLTLDGDRIELNDRDALTETMCSESTFRIDDPETGSEVEQQCELEALGGVLHMRGSAAGLQRVPQASSRTVGAGMVFLVSDNRAYHYDSRTYGPVERATCKESIFFRLVSKHGFFDVASRLTYVR